jgi:uncharacterized protein
MTMLYQERPLAEPLITPENQVFFEACNRGELLLRRCHDCEQPHWYPRNICPLCGSDRTDWVKSAGGGSIYSFSPLRRGVDIPYCVAYISLDEGVIMMSNLVDCDYDELKIGQRVQLVFRETVKGQALPMFKPSA